MNYNCHGKISMSLFSYLWSMSARVYNIQCLAEGVNTAQKF